MKFRNKMLLIAAAVFNAQLALALPPDQLKGNETVIGSKASSSDKKITFEQNAGANNPAIDSTQSGLDLRAKVSNFKVGKGTAADIKMSFDKGSGSSNPCFKWNNSTSKLQYSADCTTFKTFGLITDGDSGAATSGQVPVANGSGGISWGAAGVGYVSASGANSTATVGRYTNYIFTSSGTLTVTQGGLCKFLLVGGGGGGSHGGGGGGGVIDHYHADFLVTPGTYTVTVGAGGTGTSAAADVRGTAGGDTSFGGFTAKGGGGGGAYGATQANGGSGGSGGGGGGGGGSGAGSGGAATFDRPEVQGYAGAASPGATGGCYTSSGGGGADAVGAVGSSCTGGNGGVGRRSMIKGTVGGDYFGGGGGGGRGNSGGSCAGSTGTGGTGGGSSSQGTPGTANTGGGGAGGCSATGEVGSTGGSGIAIISCQTSDASEGIVLQLKKRGTVELERLAA